MGTQASSRYRDFVEWCKAGSRVLEIGCATGEFLAELSAGGYYTAGVEPSPECAAEARKVCPEVYVGMMEEAEYPAESFDAICMFHVLEHIESPVDALRWIWGKIKPHGLLYLEVPDVRYPYLGNLSRFFQTAHLWSFSLATLKAILAKAGFAVVWSRPLVEGKFLRVIARKEADIPEPSFPAHPWEDVQRNLRTWRWKWWLIYRWKQAVSRLIHAVKRRMMRA